MGRGTVRLPAGRHFAVTWSIPDDFGGMTEAIFRRSRSFHEMAGISVDVLTFDARPDYPLLERQLRSHGVLADGIRLLNLYDWLRAHGLPGGDPPPGDLVLDHPVAADAPRPSSETPGGGALSRVRQDAEGRTLQTDHYRADGSLLLTDRRDVNRRGEQGGRRLVLYDEGGRPVASWRRIWHLYAAWLDALTEQEPSWFIVDSKTMAPFMLTYRRPHVITAHVVHGSHRDAAGSVKESRRAALAQAHRFDVVAVLTGKQAQDLQQDLGPMANLAVIPNGRGAPAPPDAGSARSRTSGAVLASLTERKRVSHAIAAVQLANRGREAPITLDIYGDGDSRPSLQERAGDDPSIRFHGHVPHARERLSTASFALFTANSEGFPLALIEAMAAGCIPIAYDIDYGPSDVIRHGRNGFLIPPGDIAALAGAVGTAADMRDRRLRRMRARAIRVTDAFTDERVCTQWANALEYAMVRRALRHRRTIAAAATRWPAVRAVGSPALRVAMRIRRRAKALLGSASHQLR